MLYADEQDLLSSGCDVQRNWMGERLMPIIRGKHHFDGHFTQIPNAWIRDKRLSYKARGLLAELLSHEPGFEVSREKLSRNGQDGDGAIRSAIRELEANGYLKRSQNRSERQRFGAAVWTTQDPFPPSVSFSPAENPPAENRTLKKTIEEKTKERTLVRDELEPLFEEFWKVYPRRQGRGAAVKAFAKALESADAITILTGAHQYGSDANLPEKQFIPMPATWLNQERWSDGPLPERVLSPEEKLAREREDRLKRDEIRKAAEAKEAAERRKAEEAAKLNPPKLCEHERVAVICPVCTKPGK